MFQGKKNHALFGKFLQRSSNAQSSMSKITFSYAKEKQQRKNLLLGHGVFTASRLQGRVNLVRHHMKGFAPK